MCVCVCVCVVNSTSGAPKSCVWAQREMEYHWNPKFYVTFHFLKIQVAFKRLGAKQPLP